MNDESKYESHGRVSANDVAMQGIIEPYASYTNPFTGQVENTVFAGDETNIVVAVQNIGSNDVTEMNIEVTIYLADGSVATDLGPDGQWGTADDSELSWRDAVICDDAASCPYDLLEEGDWLGGGSYEVRDSSGAAIAWSAMRGEYTIAVEVDVLSGDDNQDNDMGVVEVIAVNWYDLGVELSWDSGNEQEATAGSKDFTLSVASYGSDSWSARNVTVELIISGAPLTSAETGGNDILGTTEHVVGSSQTVEIFFNVSGNDPRNFNGTRSVIDFGETETLAGSVDVDGNSDGGYTVEAILKSYTIFGAVSECTETWEEETTDSNGNTIRETKTSNNMCEVDVETDDNNTNNEDDISGYIGSFHDIGVSSVIVAQGFDAMGQGDATSIVSDGHIGVGYSKLHATVEHLGSTGTGPYDWQVDFTVTDYATGSSTTYTADECLTGVAPSYTHDNIADGMGGQPVGYACVGHTFAASQYKVEATVSMVNSANDDENSANDDAYGIFRARNHNPVVELKLSTQGDIKVGDSVTFEANAFDAEDLSGESLSYEWQRVTSAGTSVAISECNSDASYPNGHSSCTITTDATWVTTLPVTVEVSDPHYGYGSSSLDLMVWNDGTATGSSGDGAVSVSYALTYLSASNLDITFADGDAVTGVMLGTQEADSLYVIDMTLAHMDASDVLEQSLTVTFPGNAGEDYSLYYELAGMGWTLLDGMATQVDNSSMSLTWDGDGISGTLYSGSLGIFNVAADIGNVPANGISAAWGENLAGGDIAVKWNLENGGADLLAIDSIEVCADGDCSILSTSTTQHIISGNHGDVFSVTVSVVNTYGENPAIGSFTAIADAQVDPAPVIDFGVVTNESTSWTIALDTTSVGDAESFHICWKNSAFNAAALSPEDLSPRCVVVDKTNASINITKPNDTTDVLYYFAIYAEDAVGNLLATDASTSIMNWLPPQVGDSDGDGANDDSDAFPNDPTETYDSDGDGVGDNGDAFPNDANETADTDGDGIGDNADSDDDNDGVSDENDAFPLDSSEYSDSDGDGIGDNSDADDDGDGVVDANDAFPLDANETADTDGDGVGDNSDAFPQDSGETVDSDGDGVGDNSDAYPEDSSRSEEELVEDSEGGMLPGFTLLGTICALCFIALVRRIGME